MKLNKKNHIFLLGMGLVTTYLITRLYNILSIPIFTDEAIYVRWAQIFKADIHQFFISLTDGKQPLFIWAGTLNLNFIHDPLLALRLVSVSAGILTMVGIYMLASEVFNDRKTAVIASTLYVIYPFALVYDKLALYDSLLATFAVWSLYMEILLVKQRKVGIAVLCAAIIGGGLLTKSSAFFFLYLLPASLMLFNFKSETRNRDLLRWSGLAVLVVVGSMALYMILRFSPNYHYISDKNYMFIYPFHEWIRNPFIHLLENSRTLTSSFVGYSTIPLLGLMGMSFFIGRKHLKEKIFLLTWFIVPFLALALMGKHRYLYPRYIFFMVVPLLILAADSLVSIWQKITSKYLLAFIFILILFPVAYKDYIIMTDFRNAPIPSQDRKQLITGYASGYGVKETVELLEQKSKKQKVFVGTEGIFGLMPHSLQDYFYDNPNIEVKGYWPIDKEPPQQLIDEAKMKPTYIVFYAPCKYCNHTGIAPSSWPLKRVFQIEKLQKGTFYTLYQVIPR